MGGLKRGADAAPVPDRGDEARTVTVTGAPAAAGGTNGGRPRPRWDEADATGKIRRELSGAETHSSVLLDYARRPTNPNLRRASGTLVLDPPPPTSVQQIERVLSRRAVPRWDDTTVPDTRRPSTPASDLVEETPGEGPELMGTLTVIRGARPGLVVSLAPEQTLIGRSPHATVHMVEDGVSRQHARICCVGSAFVLEDLGSHNGTYVAGKPVTRVELKHGDVVRFGRNAAVRFCWMDPHQKRLLEELYETSVRDVLTGAYNRRHFAERLQTEIAYATRHRAALSLLLLDIDHFKRINDQHGHPEGDRVLTKVTSVCLQQLRQEDLLARYGGEEFAALLRGESLSRAALVAERLRAAVERTFAAERSPLVVTVSVGCASLACADQPTPSALVLAADRRLYEAKRAGRNRVVPAGDPSVTP